MKRRLAVISGDPVDFNLPVIAPKMDSFTHVCNAENSVLYDGLDIASALKAVSTMPEDDYRSMCESWETSKEQFSPENVSDRLCEFLSEL